MKNMARNYSLKSFTKWVYTNHPDWCDDPAHSVVSVKVKRVTTLNGEVISSRLIESQDHVLRLSTKEDMAALAYLRMSSHYIDEEVYVGF